MLDAIRNDTRHSEGGKSTGAVLPVIMSGGNGTRLWPLSREAYPKQYWPLASELTMLQETAARAGRPGFQAPVVICNAAHRFLVAEQMHSFSGTRIVLEPCARNSAPAIMAAALLAEQADPATVLWIMAADAVIKDLPALHAALGRAVAAAQAEYIVTFGIRPDAPETGYGYIEVGEEIGDAPGVHRVVQFLEKPDAGTAILLAAAEHLWNSGMFVARADTLIAAVEQHAPEVAETVRRAVAGSRDDLGFTRLGAAFAQAPSISIDYAVMEKAANAAVVPASLGWSDVGSWAALWQLGTKDGAGNVAQGPVELVDSEGCYVRSEGILAGVVGLQDAIVVVSEDAVLVTTRGNSQDVKRLVERLNARTKKEASEHRRVYRPWGHYETLTLGDRFQVKRIVVTPGQKLSLQKHHHRAEHWVVVAGTAVVERDGERQLLRENESIYLPLGCTHRLENPGLIPLTLIEVQSGSYLGEDDIVRFEDIYSRT